MAEGLDFENISYVERKNEKCGRMMERESVCLFEREKLREGQREK